MKSFHMRFHTGGRNTSLRGCWSHSGAWVLTVLCGQCPKEQGLGSLLRSRRLPGREGKKVDPFCRERLAAEGRCSVCSGRRMSLKCRNTALAGLRVERFQTSAPGSTCSVQSRDFTSVTGVICPDNFGLLLKALG